MLPWLQQQFYLKRVSLRERPKSSLSDKKRNKLQKGAGGLTLISYFCFCLSDISINLIDVVLLGVCSTFWMFRLRGGAGGPQLISFFIRRWTFWTLPYMASSIQSLLPVCHQTMVSMKKMIKGDAPNTGLRFHDSLCTNRL